MGACCPTDATCYPNGTGASSVGDECVAQRDNSRSVTKHLMFRQTWSKSTRPAGNTIAVIYDTLAQGSVLPWPECEMPGTSGFIQLLELNEEDPDLNNHWSRVGYAPFVTAAQVPDALQNGLCMIEGPYDNAMWRLPPEQMSPTTGWPEGLPAPMPLPWQVKPVMAQRLPADFDLTAPGERERLIQMVADDPERDAVFFANSDTGYAHGYSPQAWVVVYTGSISNFIAFPIREAETVSRVNSAEERSCIGAYRASAVDCASGLPEDPPWGCFNETCAPGEAPAVVRGYFLITELEQVFSTVLQQTLCVSYPGRQAAIDDGFAGEAWGDNCRGSPLWNPSAEDHSGLPHGDWCARTNGPATADCHDAFRSETFQAFQAFPIRAETCGFNGTLNPSTP